MKFEPLTNERPCREDVQEQIDEYKRDKRDGVFVITPRFPSHIDEQIPKSKFRSVSATVWVENNIERLTQSRESISTMRQSALNNWLAGK